MKVLLINGSPRVNGNTAFALNQMAEVFADQGIETELIQAGKEAIRGCVACGSCYKTRKCVFDDLVNEVGEKLKDADGIIVGSPVYYASPNGTLLALLDRPNSTLLDISRMLTDADFCDGELRFTYCGTEIIYRKTAHGTGSVTLTPEQSKHIFARDGEIKQLIIEL